MEREKFVRDGSHENISSIRATKNRLKPTTVAVLKQNIRRDTALLSYLLMGVDDLIDCDVDTLLKDASKREVPSEDKSFTMKPKKVQNK